MQSGLLSPPSKERISTNPLPWRERGEGRVRGIQSLRRSTYLNANAQPAPVSCRPVTGIPTCISFSRRSSRRYDPNGCSVRHIWRELSTLKFVYSCCI